MFDCQVNMPICYKRDLACRVCRGDPAGGLEDQDELYGFLPVNVVEETDAVVFCTFFSRKSLESPQEVP